MILPHSFSISPPPANRGLCFPVVLCARTGTSRDNYGFGVGCNIRNACWRSLTATIHWDDK